MTKEEAEKYAKEMTYRDAINNLMKARSIPYRKATFIKVNELLNALEQEPKKCKDCKWWRDSDGAYRRGVKAESRCPINTVSVANGWGYCYMFKSQESEEV